MSGICGIVNFDGEPVDPEVLCKMAEASAYRGPDGIHYWIDGNVGLAHLALNATPESLRERQPLLSADGMVCLTADARVDNRDELIHTLTSKGYLQEKDPTDADLILAAYQCWGEACPEYIIGDFAFAIWDAHQHRLFCARDAVGARPLCYNLEDHTFRFGSDVRQVLADSKVSRGLDGFAISDFLIWNYRDRSRTMFAAVQKLLPGHYLTFDHGSPCCWRYWNPDQSPPIRYRSEAEYIEHFQELLFRCVADRLRIAEDTVAVVTSGGVDSSSIAAIAQYLYARGRISAKPVAYTYVFDTLAECDEREYSLSLATETGIELHHIQAEQFGLFEEDEEVYIPALDGPMIGYETLTRHLHEQVRERGCDVLMNGLGGDGLFVSAKWRYVDYVRSGRWWKLWPWLAAGHRQGHSCYGLIRSLILWPLLPRRIRYMIDHRRGTQRYPHVPVWVHPQLQKKVPLAERLYHQSYPRRFRSVVRQFQYEQFIGSIEPVWALERYNVQAAEHGMESRFPFADRRLAEFMLAAPLELGARPGRGNSKWLLRQALAGVLPEKIRVRPDKVSWDGYFNHMVCHESKHRLRGFFANTRLALYQLVDDQVLLTEMDAFCKGVRQNLSGASFFPPLLMERWLRAHASEYTAMRFDSLQSWQYEKCD